MKYELATYDVNLLRGLGDSPFAHKSIEGVMNSQNYLVDIVRAFIPKIVKMDRGAPKRKNGLDEPDAIVGE